MMRFCQTIFIFLGMSLFCLHAATIQDLLISDKAVTLKLNASCSYKTFILKNPNRLVVDLENTTSLNNLEKRFKPNGLFRNLRVGQKLSHLRLVFDLTERVSAVTHKIVKKNAVYELNIQIKPLINQKPILIKHSPARNFRDVVVVIDPGHGGRDPGAMGPRRYREKDVVLSIALKLKSMIDREPGMRAVLTRRGDYYVGLRERLNIARRNKADIFISIHADAFINHLSTGASVFALSQRGATSEAARWLAEKENNSELGGVNLSELDDQTGMIRTVLIDLSQTATISASVEMGSHVLSSLDQITRLHNDKVEQARFVVLKSPDIPSILIETGFITNRTEERNLTNYYYQLKLSKAIVAGVKRYFWEFPPQGTRLEVLVAKA